MPVIKRKKGKLESSTEVESRGVSTSRDSPITITPSSNAFVSSAPPAQAAPSFTPGKDSPAKSSHGKDNPSRASHGKENSSRSSHGKENPGSASHSKEKAPRDGHVREHPNVDKSSRKKSSKSVSKDQTVFEDQQTASKDHQSHSKDHQTHSKDHQAHSKDPSSSRRSRRGHAHKRHSYQEVEPASRGVHGTRPTDLLMEGSPATVKQELLHLSLARQALQEEKMELTRLLEQREGIITELRKQMHQRDKTIQAQRAHFQDALRNVQNGKRISGAPQGESPVGRGGLGGLGAREELHLVRDAIVSLRSNFRETDPNQHTLDTLEQAIAILIERGGSGSGGSALTGDNKSSRPGEKRPSVNGAMEPSTKVIYFTERTVTPFMSTINKRLGEIRLRDFRNMFDRPGLFRFHFKSYDPEYGMVKEEIVSDDDILPGVDGKIIAWVEEDTE